MIMAIVGAVFVAAVPIVVRLVWWLGWLSGLALSLEIFAVLAVPYFCLVKPWHIRWGTTDEAVARAMPGDELIPNAGLANRPIVNAGGVARNSNTGYDRSMPWRRSSIRCMIAALKIAMAEPSAAPAAASASQCARR